MLRKLKRAKVRIENLNKSFTSNSLKDLDEKAKNLLKNSTKKHLDTQDKMKGKYKVDIKNIALTNSMSLDIHQPNKTSSKKLTREAKMRAKNRKPLEEINRLPKPKNFINL